LLEEFGLELRMPHSREMGRGLFELRPRGREGIARVIYCTEVGRKIIILHSFIKKTNETPKLEMDIARRRQREVIET
jgi:phage-related protein